jgi:hypothetical protein
MQLHRAELSEFEFTLIQLGGWITCVTPWTAESARNSKSRGAGSWRTTRREAHEKYARFELNRY